MKSETKMKIFNQKRLKFENDFYFLFPFLIILQHLKMNFV